MISSYTLIWIQASDSRVLFTAYCLVWKLFKATFVKSRQL